ncbi:MAG: hypothetical protein ACJ8F3_17525 [Xanthobacteraceae bacterium]
MKQTLVALASALSMGAVLMVATSADAGGRLLGPSVAGNCNAAVVAFPAGPPSCYGTHYGFYTPAPVVYRFYQPGPVSYDIYMAPQPVIRSCLGRVWGGRAC